MPLSESEIAIIKGMIARGDRQSDIAAYFGGSNGGSISEINTGKSALGQRALSIPSAPASELPPPGPYFVSGRSSIRAKETLTALRGLIDQALGEINSWEGGDQ